MDGSHVTIYETENCKFLPEDYGDDDDDDENYKEEWDYDWYMGKK